jgi:hypothetical protein
MVRLGARPRIGTVKIRINNLLGLTAALALSVSAGAETLYQIKFSGTANTTDASGNETQSSIDNKTLISDWATLAGVTNNEKGMILVFSHATDANGDSIQVRDKKSGDFLFTVFPLAFQESAIAQKSKGTTEKHFSYVYNLYQPGPAVGSAIMDETMVMDKKGGTNRFTASGELQWYDYPNRATPRLRINSGKFKVGSEIKSKADKSKNH